MSQSAKVMMIVVVVLKGEDVYSGRTEPALVSVSDSYSKDEEISCM